MVRMVHMNIFYRMDLEICDLKSELWAKTENIERSNKLKKWFEVQNGVSEAVPKTKMTFKNILEYSAIIPAQFPYIEISFL